MSKRHLDHVLDKLVIFSEDLGHQIVAEHEEEIISYVSDSENEYSLVGHRCETNDRIYVVAGHEDLRFGIVAYFYGIPEYVESFIHEEMADEILSESGIAKHEGERKTRAAARSLLSNVSEEDVRGLENYVELILPSSHIINVARDDQGVLNVISVEAKIFPDSDSFTIADYNETVNSVTSAGRNAQYVTESHLDIDIDEENPAESSVDLVANR